MALSRGVRKLVLTAHIACSVGWLGGVATSVVLALVGWLSPDGQLVRASYLTMELIGWYVLVPLSLASLVTGLINALGSAWGLFRHYWVLFKLLMNLFATTVLLLYMQTLGHFASIARDIAVLDDGLATLRNPSPVLHSSAALVLLLVATVLSVYKPKGVTGYGRRKLRISADRA